MNFELQQLLTHLVGFVITVWLLKKFAWGPFLSLIEERREKIVGEFKKIEDDREEVAKLTAEYEAKLREIDGERRQKLIEAVEEGKKVAADLKAAAQEEAKQLQAKAKADLEREVSKAKVQLRDDMVAITMGATEKILHEQLDDPKQRELIGRYIEELGKA